MPETRVRQRPLSEDLAEAAVGMAALLSPTGPIAEPATSPAVSDLMYRGLRGWGLAQVRLARLAHKTPDEHVSALLSIAWAALAEQMRSSHVIVDEAVAAARRIAQRQHRGAHRAASAAKHADAITGFVNAMLRKAIADPALCAADQQRPEARWNAPAWWIKRIEKDWGAQAPSVLDALHTKGPLTVRVNVHAGAGVPQYLQTLAARGLKGIQVGPQAVVIEPAVAVAQIPGFAQGWVSVQDAAAQGICGIFDDLFAQSSENPSLQAPHILDACAAPGGKAVALAERYRATIWAMDVSARRLAALDRDLPRVAQSLRGHIRPVVADVLDTASWPAALPPQFDAIVLDAPCSASGVVRRHPEIPWRRTPQAVADVADTQRRMLDALWGRLKPGGELAFVTCSVFVDEGERQRDAFLERTADARLASSPGRMLPCDDVSSGQSRDGFFFAKFKKQAGPHDSCLDGNGAVGVGSKPVGRTG